MSFLEPSSQFVGLFDLFYEYIESLLGLGIVVFNDSQKLMNIMEKVSQPTEKVEHGHIA